MILGTNFGKETLDKEFKEFRFEMLFDSVTDYEKLYKNPGKLRSMITNTIETHSLKYTEKYIQAFNNSNIQGSLYYGISDEGEIIGYPIHQYYLFWTMNLFKSYENHNVSVLFYKIEIDKYRHYFYPKADEFIEQMDLLKKEYDDYVKDFNERKDKFIQEIDAVRLSINDLINSGDRLGFVTYLKENNVEHLLSKSVLTIYPDHVIKTEKKNSDNILYWATKYRDHLLDSIVETKPKWDYSRKKIDPYFKIMLEFKPMHDYLSANGYDFYVIEVRVNPSYKKMLTTDGKIIERGLSPQGEPCCITRV